MRSSTSALAGFSMVATILKEVRRLPLLFLLVTLPGRPRPQQHHRLVTYEGEIAKKYDRPVVSKAIKEVIRARPKKAARLARAVLASENAVDLAFIGWQPDETEARTD